jgi:hypothetical protein
VKERYFYIVSTHLKIISVCFFVEMITGQVLPFWHPESMFPIKIQGRNKCRFYVQTGPNMSLKYVQLYTYS